MLYNLKVDVTLRKYHISSHSTSQTYNYLQTFEITDELIGHVNKQNVRYCSDKNPHIIREEHTQKPQKIYVWAGDSIVGSTFCRETLTDDA